MIDEGISMQKIGMVGVTHERWRARTYMHMESMHGHGTWI